MATGFLVAASGFGLLAIAASGADLSLLVIGYCVFSLGLAPVFTLTTDVIVGSVRPAQAGAAAGLSEASTELGGAFGIAVLGSLMTALYRIGLADLPELATLPIGQGLQDGAGTGGLPLSARAALGEALQVAAFLCGALALAGTALTLFIRNRAPVHQTREDTP